jgi:DNA repair protein RadC
MKTLINTSNLTDAELLSMILGGKNALLRSEYILNNITLDKLLETQPEELRHIYRLTAKQTQNIENFKSFRKRALIKKELNQIRRSSDAKDLILPYFADLTHEEFFCIFLNRANKVIKIDQLSKGGISGTITDVRLLFKNAVLLTASGVIVAHNHPSGNLNPSESDIKITAKIKEAGNLLDIQLLDHLIIYDKGFCRKPIIRPQPIVLRRDNTLGRKVSPLTRS